MGIQSSRRVSSIKRNKKSAGRSNIGRRSFGSRIKEAIAAITMSSGSAVQVPRVSTAVKRVCRSCADKDYKHGHDVTCPKSLYFGKTRQEIDIIKANKNWKSIQEGMSVSARCFFFQPIA